MISLSLKWDELSTHEDLIGNNHRASLKYIAYTSAGETEDQIRAALAAGSPPVYGNLIRASVAVLSRLSDAAHFDCEVSYASPQSKDREKPKDESHVVMEIRSSGGASVQLTFSNKLVEEVANEPAYKFAGVADLETVLGLKAADADNGSTLNAQGIPYSAGGIQIILHVWKPNGKVQAGYLLNICDAAERHVVNAGPYGPFPGGSLQFADFQATQNVGGNDAGWDFTFTFNFSRKVRPSIPGLPAFTKDKLGHEYLDVLWMPGITTQGVVMSKAVRGAIHQIFDMENFQGLFDI